MNIQQFKYVLAVAKLKHFGHAAEQSFVTQSTLSTMIGKLEDEMSVKIFDRRTKPVSITKQALRLSLRASLTADLVHFLQLRFPGLEPGSQPERGAILLTRSRPSLKQRPGKRFAQRPLRVSRSSGLNVTVY